jgi:peptidoglycan/xylan/chitin deacetylase (PgdA/CDA1 family)
VDINDKHTQRGNSQPPPRWARLALRFLLVHEVLLRMSDDKLAVLTYHRIEEPEAFAAQLDYLSKRGHPISMEDAANALRRGRPLPPRSVLLTFDDGDISLLNHGLPLLREKGIPATAFVCPGVLDTDLPLWFDEVPALIDAGASLPEVVGLSGYDARDLLKTVPDAERRELLTRLRESVPSTAEPIRRHQLRSEHLLRLEHDGVAVGSHTLTHPCLNLCDTATIRTEIAEAHRLLTNALGHEPVAFAYPDGSWGTKVIEEVATCGYPFAFVFDHRLSNWPPPTPFRCSRLRGDASDSVDWLAIRLSGLKNRPVL